MIFNYIIHCIITISILMIFHADPLMYIGGFIGSLMPDSDHHKTNIEANIKYRKRTHSLFAGFLIAAFFFLISRSLGIGILVGYWSHIISDLGEGDCRYLLWPFYIKPVFKDPYGLTAFPDKRERNLISESITRMGWFSK